MVILWPHLPSGMIQSLLGLLQIFRSAAGVSREGGHPRRSGSAFETLAGAAPARKTLVRAPFVFAVDRDEFGAGGPHCIRDQLAAGDQKLLLLWQDLRAFPSRTASVSGFQGPSTPTMADITNPAFRSRRRRDTGFWGQLLIQGARVPSEFEDCAELGGAPADSATTANLGG